MPLQSIATKLMASIVQFRMVVAVARFQRRVDSADRIADFLIISSFLYILILLGFV